MSDDTSPVAGDSDYVRLVDGIADVQLTDGDFEVADLAGSAEQTVEEPGQPAEVVQVKVPSQSQLPAPGQTQFQSQSQSQLQTKEPGQQQHLEHLEHLEQSQQQDQPQKAEGEDEDGESLHSHFAKQYEKDNGIILDRYRLLRSASLNAPELVHRVALMSCDPKLSTAKADELKEFTNLAYLELSGNNLPFGSLRNLHGLTELHLACNELTSLDMLPLEFYEEVNKVKKQREMEARQVGREIKQGDNTNETKFAQDSEEIAKLKTYLNQFPPQEDDVGFSKLRVLDLAYNFIPPASIIELTLLPKLTELNLSSNDLSRLPRDMSSFRSLRNLSLRKNQLGGTKKRDPNEFVTRHYGSSAVPAINVRPDPPQAPGGYQVGGHKVHRRGVDTDVDAIILEALSTMPFLEELDLSENLFSTWPETLVGGFKCLKFLNMSYNNYASEKSLLNVHMAPKLEWLDVRGNIFNYSQLHQGKAGLKEFRELHKNLVVEHGITIVIAQPKPRYLNTAAPPTHLMKPKISRSQRKAKEIEQAAIDVQAEEEQQQLGLLDGKERKEDEDEQDAIEATAVVDNFPVPRSAADRTRGSTGTASSYSDDSIPMSRDSNSVATSLSIAQHFRNKQQQERQEHFLQHQVAEENEGDFEDGGQDEDDEDADATLTEWIQSSQQHYKHDIVPLPGAGRNAARALERLVHASAQASAQYDRMQSEADDRERKRMGKGPAADSKWDLSRPTFLHTLRQQINDKRHQPYTNIKLKTKVWKDKLNDMKQERIREVAVGGGPTGAGELFKRNAKAVLWARMDEVLNDLQAGGGSFMSKNSSASQMLGMGEGGQSKFPLPHKKGEGKIESYVNEAHQRRVQQVRTRRAKEREHKDVEMLLSTVKGAFDNSQIIKAISYKDM